MTAATLRGIAGIEELNREYHARITEAARATFTNAQLVEAWLDHQAGSITESGRECWQTCSAHLVEYLAGRDLHVLSMNDVDAQAFAKWVETAPYAGRKKKGPLKAGSVLNHILAGSSLFGYLVSRRLALSNPFFPLIRSFKKKRRNDLRPDLRALDEAEVPLLLEACEGLDDFTLTLLLFKTGVRREEAVSIEMSEIEWDQRLIHIKPHPRRTFLKALFDEELGHFLKLLCERNRKLHPGNPWLFPSRQRKGWHVNPSYVNARFKRIVGRSRLAPTIKNKATDITTHTFRRSFTSVLKRRRETAPSGCPSHIVAVLRGDSLRSRSELTPDATQGIYTKLGTVEGEPELRFWYDRCMPQVGARKAWENLAPNREIAATVAALIRAMGAGGG